MSFPTPVPGLLPAFASNGALPPGDYAPTKSDFETRFVNTSISGPRSRIYEGWNLHRTALIEAGLSPASRQLLDGSFTTNKPSPGDLDLAVEVLISSSQFTSLSDSDPVMRLLQGPQMKSRFHCDAYPILVLPATHPDYDTVTLQIIAYWMKWFGTSRDGSPKGRVWATVGGLP
jgi:uncharacterized protein DUF6932